MCQCDYCVIWIHYEFDRSLHFDDILFYRINGRTVSSKMECKKALIKWSLNHTNLRTAPIIWHSIFHFQTWMQLFGWTKISIHSMMCRKKAVNIWNLAVKYTQVIMIRERKSQPELKKSVRPFFLVLSNVFHDFWNFFYENLSSNLNGFSFQFSRFFKKVIFCRETSKK